MFDKTMAALGVPVFIHDEESVCLLFGRDDIFLMAPVFRLYGRRH